MHTRRDAPSSSSRDRRRRANDDEDRKLRVSDPDTAGEDRGRRAQAPTQLGVKGWRDTLLRLKAELDNDNIAIVAGGVAFFAFLAIFPALAALVSVYGMMFDVDQVEQQLDTMRGVIPESALDILASQMRRTAAGGSAALSWGFIASLGLTLFSANKGMKSLVKALNVAYGERESRNIFVRTSLTLGLTLGGLLAAIIAISLVVALPGFLDQLGLGSTARTLVDVLRWPLLGLFLLGALAVVYRYGPSRTHAKWRWVSPGATVATVLWLLGSLAFSFYVENFGNYNETYGTLGAVAILLLWFYLSAFVVLLGAELNAESEHQTKEDSTTRPDKPMGGRGAFAADTLGKTPS